ncbi:MAG: hypothetical protein AABW51_03875 [Nanoarchaeota archaeon]
MKTIENKTENADALRASDFIPIKGTLDYGRRTGFPKLAEANFTQSRSMNILRAYNFVLGAATAEIAYVVGKYLVSK